MDAQSAVDIGREALSQCVLIGGPILAIVLLAGLVVSVVQTVTNVHDYSVGFIPKLVVVVVALALCLPWMMNKLADYSRASLSKVPFVSRIDR
jgi:flagellar biosynthesis protein FliQ